jgi:hypothetical protein
VSWVGIEPTFWRIKNPLQSLRLLPTRIDRHIQSHKGIDLEGSGASRVPRRGHHGPHAKRVEVAQRARCPKGTARGAPTFWRIKNPLQSLRLLPAPTWLMPEALVTTMVASSPRQPARMRVHRSHPLESNQNLSGFSRARRPTRQEWDVTLRAPRADAAFNHGCLPGHPSSSIALQLSEIADASARAAVRSAHLGPRGARSQCEHTVASRDRDYVVQITSRKVSSRVTPEPGQIPEAETSPKRRRAAWFPGRPSARSDVVHVTREEVPRWYPYRSRWPPTGPARHRTADGSAKLAVRRRSFSNSYVG